jgi:hypothetical protein
MIQLYDRDAAVVADVLSLLASFFQGDTQARTDAYNKLQDWRPGDIGETYPPGAEEHRKGAFAGQRLKSIVAAINEQLT